MIRRIFLMKVPFYRHELGPEHAESVAKVLSSAFLTSGSVGRDVEARLCDFFGAKHAASRLPVRRIAVPCRVKFRGVNVTGLVAGIVQSMRRGRICDPSEPVSCCCAPAKRL
jgi:hypothetical protein